MLRIMVTRIGGPVNPGRAHGKVSLEMNGRRPGRCYAVRRYPLLIRGVAMEPAIAPGTVGLIDVTLVLGGPGQPRPKEKPCE
jgi:hypothetical protein